MTNKSIEKYYRYAEYIAGVNGKDLLHHVYLELPEDLSHVKNKDAYIQKCLVHAYYTKKSSYNKLHNPLGSELLNDIEQKFEDPCLFDSHLLHRILLQLEIEGYTTEVRVFKDCTLNSSIRVLSKKSKIHRQTITKICKFIENEIRIRYERLDNI
jgi:hypothetical protein